MVILGFVLLGLAVAAAIIAIAQNPHAMVSVDVLGTNHSMHAYWVFVAGMVVLAVAAIGLSMMRAGVAHSARSRRERRDLAAENARLSKRMGAAGTPVMARNVAPADADVVRDDGRVYTNDADGRVMANETEGRARHTWGRRSHRTV